MEDWCLDPRKLQTTKWIQNGSDAGPESFEYFDFKVFLRGLRQKQHRLGAAVQHGASLTFSSRRWHTWSSPICWSCIHRRNYAFVAAFTKSRRGNSKTFSHAVPKRCQWKIDVWIRESFRRQNGYKMAVMLDRNPLNILNSRSFCGCVDAGYPHITSFLLGCTGWVCAELGFFFCPQTHGLWKRSLPDKI